MHYTEVEIPRERATLWFSAHRKTFSRLCGNLLSKKSITATAWLQAVMLQTGQCHIALPPPPFVKKNCSLRCGLSSKFLDHLLLSLTITGNRLYLPLNKKLQSDFTESQGMPVLYTECMIVGDTKIRDWNRNVLSSRRNAASDDNVVARLFQRGPGAEPR